ncbi:hypothetical protein [Streptomyces sp. NPDC001275]
MSLPDYRHLALLFDIDGTLIITGGAGARSWRPAFDELYGIPADIGKFTDTGMTDPDVGRKTSRPYWAASPNGTSSPDSWNAACTTCARP